MSQNPTFHERIDNSPNWLNYKHNVVKYIRALRDNVGKVFPRSSLASDSLKYLNLVDKPLGKTKGDSDAIVETLRRLYDQIDEFKTDVRGFFAIFGQEFGWSAAERKGINPYRDVGKCRTALDQYARYLTGTDSSLAQHGSYTRHHYETNYPIKPARGSSVLEISNDWEKMRTLVNDGKVWRVLFDESTDFHIDGWIEQYGELSLSAIWAVSGAKFGRNL